ncbi:hypothetical protein [Hoeflea poritis]|uniref:Transmembrane anchored protein n=1 Tax=Hoeflea poritis TaxID=2993659 RepID=A0ABT4VU12_9HYPH|nr:hypothetical protein [Hoeflea poritis]MDA4848193.1 hypothetical protein [Hoeflea poritis]
MNQAAPSTSIDDPKPLISPRLIRKIMIFVAIAGLATLALSIAGRWVGERIVMGGHSTDDTPVLLNVGENALALPANMLRFENQRKNGRYERIDAYFTWPGMEGYSRTNHRSFNQIENADQLVFLTLSGQTMPLDMSARLQPVYGRLTKKRAPMAETGLTVLEFDADSRYAGELLFVGERADQLPFVVRCLKGDNLPAGSRSCMRDVNIAPGLTMTYRFSRDLLPEWRKLDRAINGFVGQALKVGVKPVSS